MRAACQGIVANEVDTVADTVEGNRIPQAIPITLDTDYMDSRGIAINIIIIIELGLCKAQIEMTVRRETGKE
jgi:hypothetical protein